MRLHPVPNLLLALTTSLLACTDDTTDSISGALVGTAEAAPVELQTNAAAPAGDAYWLKLGNATAVRVVAPTGGTASAAVIKSGVSQFFAKHLDELHYEPISVQVGMVPGSSVYSWIDDSWQAGTIAMSGSVISKPAGAEPARALDFQAARITRTTFPTLDTSQNTTARLTLELAPVATLERTGTVIVPGSPASTPWNTNNFTVEIDGLVTTHVVRIDSFTVGEAIAGQDGERRVDFPDLRVTLARSGAQTWIQWFNDFVLAGNSGSDQERDGRIYIMAPNMNTVLATVHLHGIGIRRLATDPAFPNRMNADLYVEHMSLTVPSGGGSF